jgi:hypothetical protein
MPNHLEIQMRARRDVMMDGFEFYITVPVRGDDSRVSVMDNMTFRTIDRHTTVPAERDHVYVPVGAVQKLMDDLWTEGVRPTDYKDTREVVGAMKEHINDLRKMAFAEIELNQAEQVVASRRGPNTP